MRFQGTGADIEFSTSSGAQGPGSISFQSTAGTLNDEGLKIFPNQKLIQFYSQDSGGAKINAIQGHTQNKSEAGSIRYTACLLYTSPSPRDATLSRMPSSA